MKNATLTALQTRPVSQSGDPNVPQKLADGLYQITRRHWLWIADGVLHLPVNGLHPFVVYTSGQPKFRVPSRRGKMRYFIRAVHVMEQEPSLAADVRALAAKYGCQV